MLERVKLINNFTVLLNAKTKTRKVYYYKIFSIFDFLCSTKRQNCRGYENHGKYLSLHIHLNGDILFAKYEKMNFVLSDELTKSHG